MDVTAPPAVIGFLSVSVFGGGLFSHSGFMSVPV